MESFKAKLNKKIFHVNHLKLMNKLNKTDTFLAVTLCHITVTTISSSSTERVSLLTS